MRILVWLNLTWKQKQLAWKTAQSHLRRGKCNQISSHTPLPCAAINRDSTNTPSNKPWTKDRRRLPPETKSIQGKFLGGVCSKLQTPLARAIPCNGGNGTSLLPCSSASASSSQLSPYSLASSSYQSQEIGKQPLLKGSPKEVLEKIRTRVISTHGIKRVCAHFKI